MIHCSSLFLTGVVDVGSWSCGKKKEKNVAQLSWQSDIKVINEVLSTQTKPQNLHETSSVCLHLTFCCLLQSLFNDIIYNSYQGYHKYVVEKGVVRFSLPSVLSLDVVLPRERFKVQVANI